MRVGLGKLCLVLDKAGWVARCCGENITYGYIVTYRGLIFSAVAEMLDPLSGWLFYNMLDLYSLRSKMKISSWIAQMQSKG